MRIINFGSLNIDYVYRVPHFVKPGETLSSYDMNRFCGGKGLNQSIALARAGASVLHGGCIGPDGEMLINYMEESGVDVSGIRQSDTPTGHAVIQVNDQGQNSILLFSGANACIEPEHICQVLSGFSAGDLLLIQNEINHLPLIMESAYRQGISIALNPSPMNQQIAELPLEYVKYFFINELEAEQMTGEREQDAVCDTMLGRFPHSITVLTLGSKGAYYADESLRFFQPAVSVKAVDTTAAGDTFTGYFLAGLANGDTPQISMQYAAAAAALAVGKKGAAASIPKRQDVKEFKSKI